MNLASFEQSSSDTRPHPGSFLEPHSNKSSVGSALRLMASDDEENFLGLRNKRHHESLDEEIDELLGEPAPKRAKAVESAEEAANDELPPEVGAKENAGDDLVLFQTGEEMVGEDGAEEAPQKKYHGDMEGVDTSYWTIADFIRTPVAGISTMRIPGTALAQPAGGRGTTLPVVRSAASRPAAPEPQTIDTDPALGLYSDDAFTMQVMVGADGRIIVDAASQVIPQAQETEVVHRTEVEGGNRHITSASFAKRTRTEKWKPEDIELLYEALSFCGTDFSMIEMFFPTRTRRHVKSRFKKEEKDNPIRVEAAIRNRKPIDIEEFKKLIAIKKQYTSTGTPDPLDVALAASSEQRASDSADQNAPDAANDENALDPIPSVQQPNAPSSPKSPREIHEPALQPPNSATNKESVQQKEPELDASLETPFSPSEQPLF